MVDATYDHVELYSEVPKVWVLIRTDLGMTQGKICSQMAHATLGLYKQLQTYNEELFSVWASLDYPMETFEANHYGDFIQAVAIARDLNIG